LLATEWFASRDFCRCRLILANPAPRLYGQAKRSLPH
jgi:hypothetical protein